MSSVYLHNNGDHRGRPINKFKQVRICPFREHLWLNYKGSVVCVAVELTCESLIIARQLLNTVSAGNSISFTEVKVSLRC